MVVRKTYGMQNEVEAHYSDLSARASDALGNVALVQSFVRIDAAVQGLRFVADKLLAGQMPVLSWWALVTVITRASTTITVLAIVAGSSILAFGLGGREHAAKLLGSAYDKGQQTAQQVQQAQRQGSRLRELIDDLLDLSRLALQSSAFEGDVYCIAWLALKPDDRPMAQPRGIAPWHHRAAMLIAQAQPLAEGQAIAGLGRSGLRIGLSLMMTRRVMWSHKYLAPLNSWLDRALGRHLNTERATLRGDIALANSLISDRMVQLTGATDEAFVRRVEDVCRQYCVPGGATYTALERVVQGADGVTLVDRPHAATERPRAEADHRHAVRFKVFQGQRQVENRLGAGADRQRLGACQFEQVCRDIERLRRAAMHTTDAACGEDANADQRHARQRTSDRGRGGGLVRQSGREVAAARLAPTAAIPRPA